MPSPSYFPYFVSKKKKKKLSPLCFPHNCFCHSKNNYSQVRNVPAELQLFQREKGVFTNLPGFQAAKTPSKW